MNTQSDIIISGGGMVGMSMAIALARLGLSVTVIEKGAMSKKLEPSFDGRVSAIARSSMLLLDAIGVWEFIAPHAQPIWDIRVSDGDSPFYVHYDHRDVGSEAFGFIVENRYTRYGLHRAATLLPSLTIIDNATITYATTDAERASVTLADGQIISAKLLLNAEGKYSPLRSQMGIETLHHDYGQTAIVCTIAHTLPHEGLAQERFIPAGPFAVLPMTENRSSLVWVEPKDRLGLYLALSDEDFVQEIAERVGGYLGDISLAGERFSYPLNVVHAKHYTAARFALLGDAAHAIHPIAGQGVNLGFRDVAVLEELIRKATKQGQDIGSDALLAHYARWRRFDTIAMVGVTHGLNHLFCSSLIPVKIARGLGLWAVEHMPPLKKFFMRHAMGLVGDVPELIRKRA